MHFLSKGREKKTIKSQSVDGGYRRTWQASMPENGRREKVDFPSNRMESSLQGFYFPSVVGLNWRLPFHRYRMMLQQSFGQVLIDWIGLFFWSSLLFLYSPPLFFLFFFIFWLVTGLWGVRFWYDGRDRCQQQKAMTTTIWAIFWLLHIYRWYRSLTDDSWSRILSLSTSQWWNGIIFGRSPSHSRLVFFISDAARLFDMDAAAAIRYRKWHVRVNVDLILNTYHISVVTEARKRRAHIARHQLTHTHTIWERCGEEKKKKKPSPHFPDEMAARS